MNDMKQRQNKRQTETSQTATIHETAPISLTWHAYLWRAIWPEWMSRDMNLLLLARVFMSATRALSGIVVPIYLATIGFQGFLLGVLFTVTALVSALLSMLIGLLSDRFGRKLFLILMPGLTALASLVFAFSQHSARLVVARVLELASSALTNQQNKHFWRTRSRHSIAIISLGALASPHPWAH